MTMEKNAMGKKRIFDGGTVVPVVGREGGKLFDFPAARKGKKRPRDAGRRGEAEHSSQRWSSLPADSCASNHMALTTASRTAMVIPRAQAKYHMILSLWQVAGGE
jgi:hypothetical protein